MAVCSFLTLSCSSDPETEPGGNYATKDVAANIVGKWLLSTSSADDWITYDITATAYINAEFKQYGEYGVGSGRYAVESDKFSGSYTPDNMPTVYVDWVVTGIKPYEISVKIYNKEVFLGDASLYRVLSTINVDPGSSVTPDYRAISGSSYYSNFSVVDSSIATIDPKTGEISGKREGTTHITYETTNGICAVQVSVSNEPVKSFAELLIGTWVYDNPSEKVWERYTYEANGYMSCQWATSDSYELDESKQALYTIDGETVSFTINVDAGQLNMRMETESINDFNWTYAAYDDTHAVGKYTAQRMLQSVTLQPEGTVAPNYQSLVGNAIVQGFKSHNETVAKVNPSGLITAQSSGRTYIDVKTSKGTGVIEVCVGGGAVPVAFEECIGQSADKVHELLGGSPYYEDEELIMYKNFTSDIDMVGVDLDEWSGLVKGIIVTYNSSVKTSQVTSILEAKFIPFMSQTTETFKAYMDAALRADATVGVTWDIPGLTLTYVNLATDLFRDYSIFLRQKREYVQAKMVTEPDLSDEQSQSWFFFDNKGVKIVSVYYTDFINVYDDVRSVVTMLDGTLSTEEVTSYLKRKYTYYPEQSSAEELVFTPKDQSKAIYYTPADNMVMYFPLGGDPANAEVRAAVKQLRQKAKSIKR